MRHTNKHKYCIHQRGNAFNSAVCKFSAILHMALNGFSMNMLAGKITNNLTHIHCIINYIIPINTHWLRKQEQVKTKWEIQNQISVHVQFPVKRRGKWQVSSCLLNSSFFFNCFDSSKAPVLVSYPFLMLLDLLRHL